jgi:hypothetical protein
LVSDVSTMTTRAASEVTSLCCPERDADGRCQHGGRIVDAVADEQRLRTLGFLLARSGPFCSGEVSAWI